MVDIVVGTSENIFCVHQNLLCAKLEYFKKMFESSFAESVDQRATLPEDGANVFPLFTEWLYAGRCVPLGLKQFDGAEFLDLFQLYGFAEKICLPALLD
jgi:hypothetical protein